MNNIQNKEVNIHKLYVRSKSTASGVTLMALIITIIVLLILAAVSINVIIGNDGILSRAKKAGDRWENAERNESESLNQAVDEMDNWINGIVENTEEESTPTIEIGDYVLYTPTGSSYTVNGTYSGTGSNQVINRDTTLRWRVLDINGGQIVLISELPTSSTVKLEGVNGYNNAVKLLDDLCSTIYGSSMGTARSLKIEDITDKILGFSDSWVTSNTAFTNYGTWPYTITAGKSYPNIWKSEIGAKINGVNQNGTLVLSEQSSFVTGVTTATTSISPKQTYWSKNMTTTDFINSMYYTLFINNGSNYSTYWVSSRCVNEYYDYADFAVRGVYNGSVNANSLCTSDNYPANPTRAVRPVVFLNSGVQVTGGNGITGWEIQ